MKKWIAAWLSFAVGVVAASSLATTEMVTRAGLGHTRFSRQPDGDMPLNVAELVNVADVLRLTSEVLFRATPYSYDGELS